MKLYDYIMKMEDGAELTVWDKDFDTEFYIYRDDESDDIFQRACIDTAKAIDIVRIQSHGVIVNLMDVIDEHMDAIIEEGLYGAGTDADDVMEDINGIYSGYVSDGWMQRFADVLLTR